MYLTLLISISVSIGMCVGIYLICQDIWTACIERKYIPWCRERRNNIFSFIFYIIFLHPLPPSPILHIWRPLPRYEFIYRWIESCFIMYYTIYSSLWNLIDHQDCRKSGKSRIQLEMLLKMRGSNIIITFNYLNNEYTLWYGQFIARNNSQEYLNILRPKRIWTIWPELWLQMIDTF